MVCLDACGAKYALVRPSETLTCSHPRKNIPTRVDNAVTFRPLTTVGLEIIPDDMLWSREGETVTEDTSQRLTSAG